jgi:hypothetical protein
VDAEGAGGQREGFGDKMSEGAGNGMSGGEGRKTTVRVIELAAGSHYPNFHLDYVKVEECEV